MEKYSTGLLRVRTAAGSYKDLDVSELLSINENDLTSEFSRQAALYSYIGAMAVSAEDALNTANIAKDREYALADLAIRESAEHNGQKVTEPAVKSMVMTDEAYNEKIDIEARYQADAKLLKMLLKAMEMRAEMLVSLGAHARAELDQTGMNIRRREYQGSVDEVRSAINRAKKA